MKHRISLTIVGIVAGGAMVAGCSNPLDSLAQEGIEEGVERLVEEGIEGTSGAEVDLDFDGEGASLPSTWPASIPEPPGTVMTSFGSGEGGSVNVRVDAVEEIEAYVQAVQDAGFEPQNEFSAGISGTMLDDGEWSVIIGWVDEAGEVVGSITYATSGDASQ